MLRSRVGLLQPCEHDAVRARARARARVRVGVRVRVKVRIRVRVRVSGTVGFHLQPCEHEANVAANIKGGGVVRMSFQHVASDLRLDRRTVAPHAALVVRRRVHEVPQPRWRSWQHVWQPVETKQPPPRLRPQ
eukprot:scaffold53253_cov65-Phaeocystis_antarctica.AAC.10